MIPQKNFSRPLQPAQSGIIGRQNASSYRPDRINHVSYHRAPAARDRNAGHIGVRSMECRSGLPSQGNHQKLTLKESDREHRGARPKTNPHAFGQSAGAADRPQWYGDPAQGLSFGESAIEATATSPVHCFMTIINTLKIEKDASRGTPKERSMKNIAQLYNQKIDEQYPRMQAQVTAPDAKDSTTAWALVENSPSSSSSPDSEHAKSSYLLSDPVEDRVLMRSPRFEVIPDENWKDAVKATWDFLRANVPLKQAVDGQTLIQIQLMRKVGKSETIRLQDIKRMAQSVIYFESALRVLLPASKPGAEDTLSNWIDNDNFLTEDLTREKVIDVIENCSTIQDITTLMCPSKSMHEKDGSVRRQYSWNFQPLEDQKLVEFRSSALSLDHRQYLAWAHLILRFVEASIRTRSLDSLRRNPPNIGGLKRFLVRNRLDHAQPLFAHRADGESRQPEINLFRGTHHEQMLTTKLDADRKWGQNWIPTSKAAYF